MVRRFHEARDDPPACPEPIAGKFDTLRLVGKGYINNDTTGAVGSRHERIVWLAPAVKREAKHEIRTYRG